MTPTGSFPLKSKGSEILIPHLTFPLGLYRISVDLKLLDETQVLEHSDAIYMSVTPSPLVANIRYSFTLLLLYLVCVSLISYLRFYLSSSRGGRMRTVGSAKISTWDAYRDSLDPDLTENQKDGLKFNWFCRKFDDDK